MRAGSLFSGCGGLDLAVAEVFGTEPAWFCDPDPAAVAVLAHHWPSTPNLGDITAVDWDQVEPVDVLVGGFPCQDISNAGKREGIAGERSGLWTYFARAIGVLRPRHVVVENVAAVLVRGFDTVAADLARLGYRFAWTVLAASEVGACHRRNRLFLVATDTDSPGRVGPWSPGPELRHPDRTPAGRGNPQAVPHAEGIGWRQGRTEPTGQRRGPYVALGGAASAAHPQRRGREGHASDERWEPIERAAPDR
ncbi:DNA cytosine methyltransferase, partial [Longimycelium tulufanense]|uniref:DNA cytosine methyltransferase n=1 Tax=Longimycelium tulufanense TaxID=907463 RepID=UPI001E5D1909